MKEVLMLGGELAESLVPSTLTSQMTNESIAASAAVSQRILPPAGEAAFAPKLTRRPTGRAVSPVALWFPIRTGGALPSSIRVPGSPLAGVSGSSDLPSPFGFPSILRRSGYINRL